MRALICFILIVALLTPRASSTLMTHPVEYAVYTATGDEGIANAIGGKEYNILKWQSKNYTAINNDPSLLAEIIFEQKAEDQKLLREGEEWILGENYSLKVLSIDLTEKKARMQLLQNGNVLKDLIVGGTAASPAQLTFIYKKALGGLPDVPQFICYLHDVFHGLDANVAVVKYAFLISDQTISLPVTIPFLKANPKLYTAYEATGRDPGVASAIGAVEYHYLKWQSTDYAAIGGDPGKLSRIIVNQSSDEQKILSEGETWQMGEGYSLKIVSIDTGKKFVWLQFYRGDVKLKEEIKGGTALADNLFVYKTTIAWTGSVPQFICYLGDILHSANKSDVAIKYAFLISDKTSAIMSAEMKVDSPLIATAQRANISISVTSEGEPVAGARISLFSVGGNLEITEGLTDRSGSFITAYGSNTSGNYTLNAVVEKAGYINTSAQASIAVMSAPMEILNIALVAVALLAVTTIILWFNQKLEIHSQPREIFADGVSSARIMLEFMNYFKVPKPVRFDTEIELSTKGGTLPGSIVMPAGSSKVEIALIAPKEAGSAEIVARAGTLIAKTKIVFLPPELQLKLGAEPGELPADGKSISTITVRIDGRNGNPFTLERERAVQLTTTLGTIGSPVMIAKSSASANATLIAPIVSGVAKITVTVEGLSASIEVKFK